MTPSPERRGKSLTRTATGESAESAGATVHADAPIANHFVAQSLSNPKDLTESESTALREIRELFVKVLSDNPKIPYTEIRHALSLAYLDYRERHPKVKVYLPRQHLPQIKDGELSAKELVSMQKSIDISFDDLSPRAKKLYLDALEELNEKAKPAPTKS